MELLLLIGGVLLLDLLAMRFGVDSRALNLGEERGWWPDAPLGDPLRNYAESHLTQLRFEAEVDRTARLAGAGQASPGIGRLPSAVRTRRRETAPARTGLAPLAPARTDLHTLPLHVVEGCR